MTNVHPMDRRRLLAVLLASVCAPRLASGQTVKRVAFANVSEQIPFDVTVGESLRNAAAKRPQLQITYLDNQNDPARAIELARTVVAGDYDAFIDFNVQQAANGPIGRILKESKVKALSIQAAIPGYPLYAVDNVRSGTESGRVLGETAQARWPGLEPVIVILGCPELGPSFIQRADAAKGALTKDFPSAQVVEFSSKNDAGVARQLVFDTLTRFANRKLVIWVHVDAMALAALAAVRGAGRESEVLIATTGGDRAVFPEIRKQGSPLIGTYSFFPELWGEEILSLVERLLKGEDVPARTNPSRAEFLTASNINTYYPQ